MHVLALLGLLLLQEPDVEALLRQLSDDSIEVREKAAAALIESGAEDPVKKQLASAEGELKVRCEAILKAIATKRKFSEVLPPLKKVTIDARESKLIDVLLDLQRQTGMAMKLDGMPDTMVTVRMKDAAPLEALDAVCKAGGLGYVVDRELKGNPKAGAGGAYLAERGTPSIRFHVGYNEAPRCFVRHYAMAASSLTLNKWTDFKAPAQTLATLQLRLSWTPETRPESAWIEVASVTDDKGRSLFASAPGAGRGRQSSAGIHRSQTEQPVQLKIPEGGAASIASVRGTAKLVFLKDEKTVTFDKPLERLGTRQEYGGLAVELRDVQISGGTVKVILAVTGGRAGPPEEAGSLLQYVHSRHFRLKLADGTDAGLHETRHCRTGSLTTIEVTYRNVDAKPASVEVTVDSSYHHDSFDFELKDIPLPK